MRYLLAFALGYLAAAGGFTQSMYELNPAAAIAASCVGPFTAWDGPASSNSVWGNHATISTSSAGMLLCTPGYNDTSTNSISVWDMVVATSAKNYNNCSSPAYAQAGYLERAWAGDTHPWYFSESRPNCSFQPNTKIYTSLGTPLGTTQYSVGYNGFDAAMDFWIGTSFEDKSNFDPTLYWNGPWFSIWQGEVHDDPGDILPGSSLSPVHITGLGVQTQCWGCNFQTPTGMSAENDDPTYYGLQTVTAGSSYNIWDNRNQGYASSPGTTAPAQGRILR